MRASPVTGVSSSSPWIRRFVIRLALGVLAVVVLLGAEVRLRLGLRAAVLSAAVGGWALWRSHVSGRASRVDVS